MTTTPKKKLEVTQTVHLTKAECEFLQLALGGQLNANRELYQKLNWMPEPLKR
jgi:hypothetical protein